jgi:manganese-dependent inorganic pyrophosphatase
MEKVYIFGHRNPDTDSVTAAITLAYLRKKQGMNAVPVILSSINRETKYALNYFDVKEPIFLNDIKLKIKDLDYAKDYMVFDDTSIYMANKIMSKNGISKIPIVNKQKKVTGILSAKDIAEYSLNGNYRILDSDYKNIIATLDGEKVLKYDNIIKGNIVYSENVLNAITNKIKLTNNDILITDGKATIIDYAIKSKVKLIIVTGNKEIKDTLINVARQNKINIIKTAYNYIETIKKINFSNNVITISHNENVYTVNENEDLSDFISYVERTKYTYYPVVSNKDKCLGIVKFSNVSKQNRKKVILVDHNSYEQSAVGLDEAEILEIVDHHNLANIGTNHPINFRNMIVGSTNTIIYLMYKESSVKIPKNIAGMMLSGILSDTLILHSPTTTDYDRDAVNNLARIAGVDYKKYGFDMIAYGTNLTGKTKEQILYNDFKKYPTSSGIIGLGQIYTTDISEIENEKEEYISMLNNVEVSNDYKFVALFVTDIIKNGTYIYYSNAGKTILEEALNISLYEGYYLPKVVSRKMQVLPSILEIMK